MLNVITVVLPVFLVVAVGYGLAWRGSFKDEGFSAIMKFSQMVALPCLLFRGISQIDLSTFDLRLLSSFYLPGLICFIVGIFGARLLGRAPEDSVAIGFACFFSNCLLLGVPINERAFGLEAINTSFAIIAVHSPIVYCIGITTMEVVRSRGTPVRGLPLKVLKAMFSNFLVLAVLTGLAFNLTGLRLPSIFADAMDFIGRAGVPAALFGLGGVLYRYKPEGDLRIILMICAIGLLLHPILAYLFASSQGISGIPFQALVLSAAMAPGVNAYLFADMYGVAKRVNASSVLFATLASILTLSVWILVLH